MGDLLVFLYLIITVNEGLQPSKVRATRNSDLSGRKVGPPPFIKNPNRELVGMK